MLTNSYHKIPSFSSIHEFLWEKRRLGWYYGTSVNQTLEKYNSHTVPSEHTPVSLIVAGTLPISHTA